MLRLSFAGFMIAVLAACGVYAFKGQVQDLENRLRYVERAIDHERFEIKRLEAEWATLSNPARLAHLADTQLNLAPAEPRQIMSLDDVPFHRDLDQAPALVSSATGAATSITR